MNLNITSTHFMKIESNTVEELHPPNSDFDISKFWGYESLGIKGEEPPIYENFLKNLEFVQQKYQVSLPFEENHPLMPDNSSLSLQRFHSLIKRLKSKPDILTQCNSVIADQLQNGIIERVPESGLNSCKPGGVHYLPHHEVIRSDKKTTRLRIVYDASSKRANEVSLNDCPYRGPPLTPLIFDILVRFRMFRTVLIGDLEKAFRNVRVTPEECDYLRFLWLDDTNKDNPKLVIYRLLRLHFGLNSSPFVINATVRKHLSQYAEADKEFILKVLHSLYVDDFVSGTESGEKSFELYLKLKQCFLEGWFNMRKWNSNDPTLVQRTESKEH